MRERELQEGATRLPYFYEFEEDIPSLVHDSAWSRSKHAMIYPFSWLKHKYSRCWNILRKLLALSFIISFLVCMTYAVLKVKVSKEDSNTDFPDFTNEETESLHRMNLASSKDSPFETGCRVPDIDQPRASASLIVLARNSEIKEVISSMRSMERHFNQWFNYPWTFLNDVEFTDEFKEAVKLHTNAKVEFGVISPKHWDFPKDINRDEISEWIEAQGDREVLYGNMYSYHKMCRFYSGHFYDHPLVRKYEWYWRVEPNVKFFCDLTYDPFIEMEKQNKKYGFTITIGEIYETVPSLFRVTKAFIKENNIQVESGWDIVASKFNTIHGDYVSDIDHWDDLEDLQKQVNGLTYLRRLLNKKDKTNQDFESIQEFQRVTDIFKKASEKPSLYLDRIDDEEYNLCHFWTNFEIAKTEIFLSKTYQEYFKYLERSGGFYKERWGDAPVHSLAIAMMLPKEQLHYFRDIGYSHTTLGHCPGNAPGKQLPYTSNGFKDDEKPGYSVFTGSGPDKPVRNGVGCRCECPLYISETEIKHSKCLKNFARVLSDDFVPHFPIDLRPMERSAERRLNKQLRKGELTWQDEK